MAVTSTETQPISQQSASVSEQSNRYLYIMAFTTGMTALAIEISASRLLGNVFGTSNLVWANIIGLMLLYLTVGYFIGGWLADRSPKRVTLYRIVLWAAFLSSMTPLAANPVLRVASWAVVQLNGQLVVGSFLAVLLLFSVPVTLLGTVSPFVIRLTLDSVEDAGRISGRIYAVSTLGSLVGTFLPVLVLTPLIGTVQTFLFFSALLFIVAIIGLWQERGRPSLTNLWMVFAVVVLTTFTVNIQTHAPISDDFAIIHEEESAYNYIQVQEGAGGHRLLLLNEGQGFHSQWHPEQVIYYRTWSYFLIGPYFNTPPYTPADVDSMALIGLAAGTIPRQYITVYGDVPIDGVEIDPGIVEVGAEYFQMNAEYMPSLNVQVQDGRWALNQSDRAYSVIAVDAYRPPYIPWHLTTVEFFQEADTHLQDDGVVIINVGRTQTDRRLVNAMTATLLEVFPSVHTMDVPNTLNTILVATRQPTQPENLSANLAALPPDAHPILPDMLNRGVDALVQTTPSDLVFTDNHAPVELLVDSIVINFLFEGNLDTLR